MVTTKILVLLVLVSVLCMVDSGGVQSRQGGRPRQSPRPDRPNRPNRPNQSPTNRPNRPNQSPTNRPNRPNQSPTNRPNRPRPNQSPTNRPNRPNQSPRPTNQPNNRPGHKPADNMNRRCPKIACDLVCEYRKALDKNGCPTCSCFQGLRDSGPRRSGAISPADRTPNMTKICEMMCPTGRQLLRKQSCPRGCIIPIDNCPGCNSTCSALLSNRRNPDSSECKSKSDCGEDQYCVPVGISGQTNCVDFPGEGEKCGISVSFSGVSGIVGSRRQASRGRSPGSRVRTILSRLKTLILPCKSGLVCTRVDIGRKECRPENPKGPCVQARVQNPNLTCSEDGYYRPLQCKPITRNRYECACVNARSGEVIDGTTRRVFRPLFAPECEVMGFESCTIRIGMEDYEAKHGQTVLDLGNCSKCICKDGELQLCKDLGYNCGHINTSRACVVHKVIVPHGRRFSVDGCKMCQCRNARAICPRAQCGSNDPHKGDRCLRCRQVSRSPVCGPNGKTYPSRCYATECANFTDVDVLDGACNNHDPCKLHPCEDGEVCVKRVGVSCLGLMGCRPDNLRSCLNPSSLMCEQNGVQLEDRDECDANSSQIDLDMHNHMDGDSDDHGRDDDDDNYICGSNARSYRSICQLLQDTAFTSQVKHTGRCGARKCRSGMVCGTDGVTYENICLLRSQAGSARVDYRGMCQNSASDSIDNMCRRIRRQGKCQYTKKNCKKLAVQEEGCCPVCGGVVTLAIDIEGLSEYFMLNPDEPNTPDAIVEQLEEFLNQIEEFSNITSRCEVEGSLTSSNNFELIFEAKDPSSDAEYCHTVSGEVTDVINGLQLPMASGGEEVVRQPVLQFFSAAMTAPLQSELDDENYNEKKSSSGATILPLSASTLLLVSIFWGLNKL